MNLKRVLMDLGNALVTEYGYLPAAVTSVSVSPDRETTKPIDDFTRWLNDTPDAREVLDRMGVAWPVVERPKPDTSALREIGGRIRNQPIHLIEPVDPGKRP